MFIGGKSCVELAERYGTPVYVMDEGRLRENYRRLKSAFSGRLRKFRIHYAMKANSNLSVLGILRQEGAGVDCASLEEAKIALMAGYSAKDIMLTASYIDESDLREAIRMGLLVNIDDSSALDSIPRGKIPRALCFRINPGFGKAVFPSLTLGGSDSKFGMDGQAMVACLRTAHEMGVQSFGIHMMAGSGSLDAVYFGQVTERMLEIAVAVADAAGVSFDFIDVGGGFGVPYRTSERPLDVELVAEEVCGALRKTFGNGREPTLLIEPGRYLVCDSGILLSRVRAIKQGRIPFIGIDAGMNTLLRPALYGAHHEVLLANRLEKKTAAANVCGTVCENTDIMARERVLPRMAPGDLVAILNAGAYGFCMSSHYNGKPRPPEVLVARGKSELVREGESIRDVVGRQKVPARLKPRRVRGPRS